jgi:hypothetical protein
LCRRIFPPLSAWGIYCRARIASLSVCVGFGLRSRVLARMMDCASHCEQPGSIAPHNAYSTSALEATELVFDPFCQWVSTMYLQIGTRTLPLTVPQRQCSRISSTLTRHHDRSRSMRDSSIGTDPVLGFHMAAFPDARSESQVTFRIDLSSRNTRLSSCPKYSTRGSYRQNLEGGSSTSVRAPGSGHWP